MLNAIWIALVVVAVAAGAVAGTLNDVTLASAASARKAVELVIGLFGVMAFWFGLMRVLQNGGFVRTLARAMAPVTRRLFPDVPPDHPAMGMMLMNMASNLLGLGNAATPFGLKAMVELQRLNRGSAVASNAMILFLAINTSSITILPTTMIGLRESLGSPRPAVIMASTFLATVVSTLVALVVARSLSSVRWFSPAEDVAADAPAPLTDHEPSDEQPRTEAPPAQQRWAIGLGLSAAIVLGSVFVQRLVSEGDAGALLFEVAADWSLSVIIAAIGLYGLYRGVNVYETAVEGAREAFDIALRFVPYFIVLFVAIGMFQGSGAMERLVGVMTPVLSPLGVPAEVVPVALLRPLTGSGSLAMVATVMESSGTESLVGLMASTMQGSTETTFYVLALYFGVIGIRFGRHVLIACLAADAAGMFASVWVCRWLFG